MSPHGPSQVMALFCFATSVYQSHRMEPSKVPPTQNSVSMSAGMGLEISETRELRLSRRESLPNIIE